MANQRHASSEAERILCCGYNYTTGYDDMLSSPTGGLFFIAIQRDPRRRSGRSRRASRPATG